MSAKSLIFLKGLVRTHVVDFLGSPWLDPRIVGVHIRTYAWEVPRVCMFQLDKIPREEMESELAKLNVPNEAIDGILKALTLKSLDDLEG